MKRNSLLWMLCISTTLVFPLLSGCTAAQRPDPQVQAARPTAATAGRTAPNTQESPEGQLRYGRMTAAQLRNEEGPVISLGNGAYNAYKQGPSAQVAPAAPGSAALPAVTVEPAMDQVQSWANQPALQQAPAQQQARSTSQGRSQTLGAMPVHSRAAAAPGHGQGPGQGQSRTYWPLLDRSVRVALPPASVIPPQESRQVLNLSYGAINQSIDVLFRADGQRLLMAGSAPLGIKLFTARYDSNGIHTSMLVEFKGLPRPEQVLLDVMLSLAPADAWSSVLPPGYAVTDRGGDRIVTNSKGQAISIISYADVGGKRKPVRMVNKVFGYQINISYR
ncbi:DUF3261 domain-containing protein [Anaerobiospirillum sp. NML120449]|uniref:DUF3261 domain-containing protein n=1 Tax=Anaerobiospirillum sp. NML120449 TaxID=2932817 RepID=UPI001FF3C797|nr:DUF3261 domain-containing protein [Anaerobiospirillum sp. NML120449]MCK0526335.1 DUF3261 domain-containing protein [Anaerobiospirillum sp. NML120449]